MDFLTPGKVHFGWNSVDNLKKIKKNAVIVTGKHLWPEVSDFVPLNARVYELSRSSKTGEPHEEDIEKVAEFLEENQPKWVIAVGGGSVIDSTKLAKVFYEYPELEWSEIYAGRIPELHNKARLIAIETTSGTGTGISAAAVVTDKNSLKHGIVSPDFIPDISIYDPNFVMSMSEQILIHSGMDALAHAIEAYISKVDNIPADTLALKAIELIFSNIQKSREGMEDAREIMHYGNMLAAIGFTNSRLTLCHAAAHKIGGRYDIKHGKIVAILLPHFIRATYGYTRRYEDIEKMLRIDNLSHAIEELNENFGIPQTFPAMRGEIEKIAKQIMLDPLMRYNPGRMNIEDILKFLKNAAGEY